MSTVAAASKSTHLPSYAVFAALLSAAGLPIYIHAPKFYSDEYGVSLASLGVVLFGLRLLDVVQDPFLGKLSARLSAQRGTAVGVGCLVMATAMFGLFAVPPPIPALWWFAAMLTLVFSAFSFLTITFYAQGVTKAADLPAQGHLHLARWRETGALLGVCAAAIAPVVLGSWMMAPFSGFAIGFVLLAVGATAMMRTEWRGGEVADQTGFGVVLKDAQARQLLIIALINAAPVAVSSTLFLYFVESGLAAPGKEGVLLLLFFLSAAVSAPIWGMLAAQFGIKPVLLSAMFAAVVAFGFALLLGPGDWAWFALICIVSGATLGADLTLLPAAFARRMATISPTAAEGFGLWSFVSKITLAFAAVSLLPALDQVGFTAGGTQTPAAALTLLTILYAGVPCALKLVAIALVACSNLEKA